MSAARQLPKVAQFEVSGIVAPILRTLQAGERIVRRNEAGELVTLDLAEIARRVGDATGHRIAVARRTPVKVVDASGRVVKALSADEFFAKLLSRHFGVVVAPPKPDAKATLFWCACGVVEDVTTMVHPGRKNRCGACAKSAAVARSRAWAAANPDRVRAKRASEKYRQAKARRRKAGADKETMREWRLSHRDEVRAYMLAYRAKYADRIKAQKRARYHAKKSGGAS